MHYIYFRKIAIRLLYCLLPIIFLGCATQIDRTLQSVGIKHKIQTNKIIAQSSIANDIKLSVSALVVEMRHKHLRSNLISFDKKGSHLIYEKNFRYRNFRWDFMKISKYSEISNKGNVAKFRLEGMLYFSDNIGRTASVLFSMDYKVINKKRIVILNSEIFHHYLASANVQTYFVPLYKLKKQPRVLKNFLSLYKFANKNAIRVIANKDEYNTYKHLRFIDKLKGRLPNKSIKGSFAAIVFAMERFPINAKMSIKIGDGKGHIFSENKLSIIYRDYNGWKVGIVGFNGEVRAHRNIFTINVYFQKNSRAEGQLIGKFNNAMDYKINKSKNGPLGKGEILLDPSIKTNAKIIQARLKFFGYYNGKIDGDFGRNSKKALGYFIKDYLKAHYNKWSLKVQKRLFRNSGF